MPMALSSTDSVTRATTRTKSERQWGAHLRSLTATFCTDNPNNRREWKLGLRSRIGPPGHLYCKCCALRGIGNFLSPSLRRRYRYYRLNDRAHAGSPKPCPSRRVERENSLRPSHCQPVRPSCVRSIVLVFSASYHFSHKVGHKTRPGWHMQIQC